MIFLHSLIFFEVPQWLQPILNWDRTAFLKVNTQWINPIFDWIFPVLRNPKTWIPLYIGLLVFGIVRLKKQSLVWIGMALVCVLMTDQISSSFLKDYFSRIRPCHELSLEGIARQIVIYCPVSGSFPSSHAVNHFGIGTYFFLTLRPYFKKWSRLFFLWAGLICYAQVYVGVHYPVDVIIGAGLGLLLGVVAYLIYGKMCRQWFSPVCDLPD